MAKVTAEHLVAGAKIWMEGYDQNTLTKVPLELIVVSNTFSQNRHITVSYANQADIEIIGPTNREEGFLLWPADRGIRPYNYDYRPTQLFTTREEMESAINFWEGENPNFLEGE